MPAHRMTSAILVVALAGCQQSELPRKEPPVAASPAVEDQVSNVVKQHAVAAKDAFVPAPETQATAVNDNNVNDNNDTADHSPGSGRGRMGRGRRGMGRGMMGRGHGSGMREDMTILHAMFDGREKITRTIKNLPNGAETVTESKDEEIASLIQQHVPAMEGRVEGNDPLPPMTFHPLFVELIRHADKFTLNYETTDHGLKVTYTSDDPYVVLLVQEHAKLVSRFIKNGMEEIHKPYTIPKPNDKTAPKSNVSEREKADSSGDIEPRRPTGSED